MEDVANLFSLDMTNVKDLSFDFYELEEMLVKRDYKTLSVLVKSINLESLNQRRSATCRVVEIYFTVSSRTQTRCCYKKVGVS